MSIQTSAPLNYFLHAHGPAAHPVMLLGWVFTSIVLSVCVIIALLLLTAILRPRSLTPPPINHRGGVRFITIGTGITVCVLLGMTVYMMVTLNRVSKPPSAPALAITVTGHDWWWQADYDGFSTANEIHIPVGVPVLLHLKSADVIHAFWAPQLAGKTQMIPGMDNRQWLEADEPGVYYGQCTQFCGLQHAHMAFEVVAENSRDFSAWETAQRRPATSRPPRIFMKNCASCHAVRGTAAAGGHAPDLTHLMSRRLIAAGLLANTPEHLMAWIRHPQELKPGCLMPDFRFPPDQETSLSAYLATLK